ncbi:MAG: 3-deoxy-D-manno-octulosonic acid transferase [Gemmataceae bacterium]
MLLNGLYLLVLVMLSPWLFWRRLRTGRYRTSLGEKLLGRVHVSNPEGKPVAWFHGVSVGEIHLLAIVVAAFRKRHPDWFIVVSSTTDTGLAEARSRFADLAVIPWPFDFTWAVRRAMKTVKPNLLILAEGELWPNAVRIAKESGARVAVINARMSPRSLARSQRVAGLLRRLLYRHIDRFAVQTEEYAERFQRLGVDASQIVVTGSVKYDGAVGDRTSPRAETLRRLFFGETVTSDRLIWVAGSTHAPEEQICLDAFVKVKETFPNCHLLLVPRHPDRFDEVARLIESARIPFVRRSQLTVTPADLPPLILLDTVGELGSAWALADVGYVGGTLDGKRGGQSMIEPAGYGVPTVFGPHVWNFKDAAQRLIESGGAIMIRSAEELAPALSELLANPDIRVKRGQSARQLVMTQQGATERTLNVLDQLIQSATLPPPTVRKDS